MPNLTVQEALDQLVDAVESAGYEHDEAHALVAEYTAAHDAEGAEGKWEARKTDDGAWKIGRNDRWQSVWCPDEATARAYAKALNRADHSLKEGT